MTIRAAEVPSYLELLKDGYSFAALIFQREKLLLRCACHWKSFAETKPRGWLEK